MTPHFEAVPDATVTGPTMVRLSCLCVVDGDGAIWSPCEGIEDTHAGAVRLARLGMTAAGLAQLLDAMRAHVAACHPAAAAQQGALL